MRKLLSSLDKLHRQGTLGRYILVGHSLGGVVALHARKQAILDNLAAGRGETHLTVLLNPAASAKEYQPLDKWLSPEGFGPSMLVLQSKTDFAVREAFNWIKDGERAVGNSWAITHDVDPCSGRDCNKVVKIPQWLLEHDAKPGCMQVLQGAGWKIRARLHARKTVQSCEDANRQAVWVLAVADGVIAGHNGILTDDQALALNAWMKSKLTAATEVVPAEAVAEPSVISPHLSDEPVLPSMENIPTEVATEPLSSAVELEPQESESAVPAISEPTLEAPLVAQPEERAPQ